jgi:hypothetical protein
LNLRHSTSFQVTNRLTRLGNWAADSVRKPGHLFLYLSWPTESIHPWPVMFQPPGCADIYEGTAKKTSSKCLKYGDENDPSLLSLVVVAAAPSKRVLIVINSPHQQTDLSKSLVSPQLYWVYNYPTSTPLSKRRWEYILHRTWLGKRRLQYFPFADKGESIVRSYPQFQRTRCEQECRRQ